MGSPIQQGGKTVVKSQQCRFVTPLGVQAGRSPWTKTVSGYFQLATMAGRAVIKQASGPDVWEKQQLRV